MRQVVDVASRFRLGAFALLGPGGFTGPTPSGFPGPTPGGFPGPTPGGFPGPTPGSFPLPPPPSVRFCGLAVRGAKADQARFRRDLAQARAIWGQCGIGILEGDFTTIDADLDYPNWGHYTQAPVALLNQRATCARTDIRVYYVRSIFGSTTRGRAITPFGDRGVIALGDDAHPYLLAHELGHLLLGEEHRDGPTPADRMNIMRSNVSSIEGAPQADAVQCSRAIASIRLGQTARGGEGLSVRALVGAATDAAPAVRVIAATALGQLGGLAAQVTLMGSARDPEPLVRTAALRSLASIRSPLAQATILDRVRLEPDPNVRALASGLALGFRL